jgi:hypothetical protein
MHRPESKIEREVKFYATNLANKASPWKSMYSINWRILFRSFCAYRWRHLWNKIRTLVTKVLYIAMKRVYYSLCSDVRNTGCCSKAQQTHRSVHVSVFCTWSMVSGAEDYKSRRRSSNKSCHARLHTLSDLMKGTWFIAETRVRFLGL